MVAWDWDPSTDELVLSGALAQILGAPGAAAVRTGEDLLALSHPEDRSRVRKARSDALAARAEYREEFRLIGPDGSVRWVVDRGSAIRGRDGRADHMSGVLRDVTEQKRAEAEVRALCATLKRQAAEQNALLDAMPIGIFIADDPMCDSVRANLAGARIIAVPPGTDVSKTGTGRASVPVRVMRDGVELPGEELLMQKAARTGTSFVEEADVVRADGVAIRALLHATPLLDERGCVRGCVGAFVDITERRRAEEALRESEERFRVAQELSLDAFTILQAVRDGSGSIIDFGCRYVNPVGARLLGRPRDELIGQRIFSLLPRDKERREIFERFVAVVETGEPYGGELRHEAGGASEWLRLMAVKLEDGVAAYLSDITARKLAEEARIEADRRKDEFLATLAHELRNPLAPIRNAVHILRLKEPLGAEACSARDVIERQVEQMTRLVDDLLDISRITRGKLELRKERVALASVVDRALETSRPLVLAARHCLCVRLPDASLILDADPTRVAQIFANLLNNAAKYTPPGGRLELVARQERREVVIEVRDDGIGIPPDMLARVFDMFTQLDASVERAQGGLGLGLTLVKQLVEMHGGSVKAESAGVGQGSVFTVRLPLAPERRADAPGAPGTGDLASTARRRILVADDNKDAADSLAMLLGLIGHDVRVAYDGRQALQVAEEHRPEVALLDVNMPEMDGHEVARRLRERPETQGTFLLAMTGRGRDADKRASKSAGFDHHLVKPVDPKVLIALLSGAPHRAA